MVEKFLLDIIQRVRSKKIGIFISGDMMDEKSLDQLPELRNKLKTIGELKFATVIYQGKLPDKHYDKLKHVGFSHRIVPSNAELHLIIEVYDTFLRSDIDFLIIASNNEKIIPLLFEVRKKSTVYGIRMKVDLPRSIVESIDGVINLFDLETFHLDEASIPEFTIDGTDSLETVESNLEIDLANIGPTSDRIDEQLDTDDVF